MNNSSVPDARTSVRERAATAVGATNPALIAYIIFLVCLTAAVIL